MTCLIIDDNPMARVVLQHLLQDIEGVKIMGECASAIEAYNLLQQESVDLLLLDVEMPGMSGLELIQSLRTQPIVILVTSKEQYAVEGYNLQVADYLLKPITYPRLLLAIQRARRFLPLPVSESNNSRTALTDSEHLFVRSNNALVRLRWDDVLFMAALGDYVTIVTAQKKHPVHTTMKSLEERLPNEQFIRIHRSYIVSLQHIDRIEEHTIFIADQQLSVSESYRAELHKRLKIL